MITGKALVRGSARSSRVHRVRQQFVDLAGAFIGPGVDQKIAYFLRRRQRADGVDGDAAEKFGIAGQIRRHDVQTPQLGEDLAVDEIEPSCVPA
jgi:hypothetical protein